MNVARKDVPRKFHRFRWGSEEFVAKYVEELDREMRSMFLRRYSVSPTQDMLEECLSLIHECMLKCARVAEKSCERGHVGRKRKKLYGESLVLQELFDETKYWHQVWKEEACEEAYSKWKECKRMCREEERKQVESSKRSGCDKLNYLLWNDRDTFWKYVRGQRMGVRGVDLRDIDFVSYYRSLYADSGDDDVFQREISDCVLAKDRELDGRRLEATVSVLDVRKALSGLSLGKAVGYDGICAEMYRYGEETALSILLTWLLEWMFKLGFIPKGMNISMITPIPKGNKASKDPSDFRPISVSTTFAIVFESVTKSMISLPMHSNQFGFKPQTSTKHAYFVVSETLKYYSSGGSRCWAISLDATKAFDKLWRKGLFYKLIGKVPDCVWRVLFKYYECSLGAVRIDGWKSEIFRIELGVKQGGVLSPFLFNFFLNEMIEEGIKLGVGAHIYDVNVSIVGYCDDIILLSPVVRHLRILLKWCEEYAHKWKIKFNPTKSIAFCTDASHNEICVLEMCGGRINFVDGFVYLGIPIGNQEFVDSFWESRFKAVEKAYFCLAKIGIHKQYMMPRCYSFIYKVYIQSIFNYGLELCTISKGLLKKLDIRQGILIKSALGLSRYSRTRPLLDALDIMSITQLYFKFKYLLLPQLRRNWITDSVRSKLEEYYRIVKKPRSSYFHQVQELQKVIGISVEEVRRDEIVKLLKSKLGSPNLGLVDSIRYVVSIYGELSDARGLLAGLVWVDFYNGSGT